MATGRRDPAKALLTRALVIHPDLQTRSPVVRQARELLHAGCRFYHVPYPYCYRCPIGQDAHVCGLSSWRHLLARRLDLLEGAVGRVEA